MTGQVAAQIAAVVALCATGAASAVIMWYTPVPWSSTVRTEYERLKSSPVPVRVLKVVVEAAFITVGMGAACKYLLHVSWVPAIIFGFVAYFVALGLYRWYVRVAAYAAVVCYVVIAYATQGMMAAQLLALAACVAGFGKVRAAILAFGRRGKPRASLGSVPLWLVICVMAGALDILTTPRTLDAVMHGWRPLYVFDNPHVPEAAHGSFWYQFMFAEQHLMLGLLAPLATTLLLGAMGMWARELNEKRLVIWPFAGWAVGLGAALMVALVRHTDVLAASYMVAGIVLGTVVGVSRSKCRPLLWHFDLSWFADNHEHRFI